MKSCLICDDHVMMRESLSGVIEGAWPAAEIRFAADFPSAWASLASSPAFCMSDLVMPGASPIEGIARMRQIAPKVPILVFTGNEDSNLLLKLFDLGIAGLVSKTSRPQILEAAIRVVLAGERYLPQHLLPVAQGQSGSGTPLVPMPSARLTERQMDVLRLIAGGQSNKEVARELELSPATVKAHAAAAIAALGATNRTEAAMTARELGLI